jgi:hypothetical protein
MRFIMGEAMPEAMQIASPRPKPPRAVAGRPAAASFIAPAREQRTTPMTTTASPANSSRPRRVASWSGCSTASGTMEPTAAVSEMMMAKASAMPTRAMPSPNSTDPTPHPAPNSAVRAITPPGTPG